MEGRTDRRMDGRKDGQTDGRTDRPTGRPSYREARKHLKTVDLNSGWKWFQFFPSGHLVKFQENDLFYWSKGIYLNNSAYDMGYYKIENMGESNIECRKMNKVYIVVNMIKICRQNQTFDEKGSHPRYSRTIFHLMDKRGHITYQPSSWSLEIEQQQIVFTSACFIARKPIKTCKASEGIIANWPSPYNVKNNSQ